MDECIAYQLALDYLYSYVDYSLTHSFKYSPEEFDLSRMQALLESLDNPHKDYKVLHVAGTKGKGSVSAMMASALHANGYKVGFYTSPHLQEYTERFQINGSEISKCEMAELVEELKPHVEKIQRLTTFEITTALAFLYFSRHKVDVAVIEVGLGGRLDATNLVDPLVSVITALSMDHMVVLGNTLAKIASEKAGIIKPGKPVVLSPQKYEALEVVAEIAKKNHSRLLLLGREYRYAADSHSLDGQSLLIWSSKDQTLMDQYLENGECDEWKPLRLEIPLLGYHQATNAATAYVALQAAREEGLMITDDAIREGFKTVKWPARFEILHREPPVIIDSAHNRDSALKLRVAIDDYFDGLPVILVFGASADKDIDGMYAELLPRVERVITTESTHPRAKDAQQLAELARQCGRPAQAVVPVEKALKTALDLAGNKKVILVAGSLFIAAAVRAVWNRVSVVGLEEK